jgi:hypothetical protein
VIYGSCELLYGIRYYWLGIGGQAREDIHSAALVSVYEITDLLEALNADGS